MRRLLAILVVAVLLALSFAIFTGCESTEGGETTVSGGVYYGVGFYDPWYYGDYNYDRDVIVTPPSRPPPHVEHPIARPPSTAPRPTPMPSIPSAPRASFRR